MGTPLTFSGHDPDQAFLMDENIHSIPEQDVFIEFLIETLSEGADKALARWRGSYGELELPLFPDSTRVEETELLFPFQYSPYRLGAMICRVRERLQ